MSIPEPARSAMPRRIAIIQGHPDARARHFGHGLADEYAKGAEDGSHDHLVILYPLWLGDMPAILKAFFEQTFRPGFAFTPAEQGHVPKKRLTGKSARIVVTMGMPAVLYRWFFLAHGLKNLERNILGFSGIGPIRSSLIGTVEGMDDRQRAGWLDQMRALGEAGQ
jgi:putative NADPH-quinone reductase